MSLNQAISAVVIELVDTEIASIDLHGQVQHSPDSTVDDSPQMEELLRTIDAIGASQHKSQTSHTDHPWMRFDPSRSRARGNPSIQTVTTTISTIAVSIASLGSGAIFLKLTRDVLIQWLKNRAGRRIRVKVGDTSVEIHGSANVSEAISVLADLEAHRTASAISVAKSGKETPRKASARKKTEQ